MSAVSATCSRTVGHLRNFCSAAFAIGGFLSAVAVLFSLSLDSAEGLRISPVSPFVASVAQVLPFLCAVLTMDVWSEEFRTGRVEMLLTSPVRERELVFGKFSGVFAVVLFCISLSFAVLFVPLFFMAPEAAAGFTVAQLAFAFIALGLQGALYTAAGTAISAFFVNSAASVITSLAVIWALPCGIWKAFIVWFPGMAVSFGEFPPVGHAVDIAGGTVSVAVIVFYLLFTPLSLFIAGKLVFSRRFRGKGSAMFRLSTSASVVLALAAATAALVFAVRLDVSLEAPLGGEARFSQRTLGILSESRGETTATCFVPRKDSRFRSVSRLLRSLARESAALGGSRISVVHVDPHWNLGESDRLLRDGVKSPSIVFSSGRRRIALPLDDGWGERACASAILRLTVPPSRNAVYWTVGHGEASVSDYGPSGMSDIARDLAHEGYRNFNLDLADGSKVPPECALIVVAGARKEFSRSEIARLDSFLRHGGRLLVLAEGPESALLSTLMPSWGALIAGTAAKPGRTLSGTDAVISEFGAHPVSEPLTGMQIVLERPVLFAPSAAAGYSTGADRIEFTPLAVLDSQPAAVMLERGAGAGADTTIRPTRIALLGDASFIRNARLEACANANRDFLLNVFSYLSGSHAITAGGIDAGLFVTGLDRRDRLRFLALTAFAIPAAVMLLLLAVVWRRRCRG